MEEYVVSAEQTALPVKEQRQLLSKKWKIVPLCGSKTANQQRRGMVNKFKNPNKHMVDYIRKTAWEDDEAGRAKVYLVLARKDKCQDTAEDSFETKKKRASYEMVGYFALKAGLLYTEVKEEEIRTLSKEEDTFVERYKGLYANSLKSADAKAFLTTFRELSYSVWAYKGKSREDVKELMDIGERRFWINHDRYYTQETNKSQLVEECFAAVELTHLAKNYAYENPEGVDVGFSSYIFWEGIVPLLLEASNKIGLEYIYLFAAQSNPMDPKKPEYSPMDNSLVQHYANNLNFRLIDEFKVLKPYFDYSCFSMFQEIKNLPQNRIAFWASHSEDI